MKLRLRPEEQTELLILALGLVASYAVQELTAHAIRWHVDAHAADEEVTRLRAENDQLRAENADSLEVVERSCREREALERQVDAAISDRWELGRRLKRLYQHDADLERISLLPLRADHLPPHED